MKILTKYITKNKFKNLITNRNLLTSIKSRLHHPAGQIVKQCCPLGNRHHSLIHKKRVACLITATLVCTCLAIARPYLSNVLFPDTVTTAAAKKQLPIYCVDTGTNKKISISFDAAWGAGRLRRSYNFPGS
jgi:hypothetical protein